MLIHRVRLRDFALRARLRGRQIVGFAASILILALVSMRAVVAQSGALKAEEIDTEHMFGFTEGSEIGLMGETELMMDSVGSFGRIGGSYRQIASTFEAKYTLTDRFRVSAAATPAYQDMLAPAGGNLQRAQLQSLSFSARYRLLDHGQAPFALTFSIEPRLGLADPTSGAPADQIAAEFSVLADRELVNDRLFGAFNLLYDLDRTRLHGEAEPDFSATLAVGLALAGRIERGIFLGGEVRYLRQYDSPPLSAFAGQALYIGPTIYATLGEHGLISAAWNTQTWGAVAGMSGAHDLVHFNRHELKLRLAFSF